MFDRQDRVVGGMISGKTTASSRGVEARGAKSQLIRNLSEYAPFYV